MNKIYRIYQQSQNFLNSIYRISQQHFSVGWIFILRTLRLVEKPVKKWFSEVIYDLNLWMKFAMEWNRVAFQGKLPCTPSVKFLSMMNNCAQICWIYQWSRIFFISIYRVSLSDKCHSRINVSVVWISQSQMNIFLRWISQSHINF